MSTETNIFEIGDRVRHTRVASATNSKNACMGTVTSIYQNGIRVKWDSEHTISYNVATGCVKKI